MCFVPVAIFHARVVLARAHGGSPREKDGSYCGALGRGSWPTYTHTHALDNSDLLFGLYGSVRAWFMRAFRIRRVVSCPRPCSTRATQVVQVVGKEKAHDANVIVWLIRSEVFYLCDLCCNADDIRRKVFTLDGGECRTAPICIRCQHFYNMPLVFS